MMTTDIKLQICLGVVPGTTTYTIRVSCKGATNAYGAPTYLPTKLLVQLLEQHRIASHLPLVFFQNTEIQTPCSRKTYPMYPSMSYGALPGAFPEIP